MAPSASSAVSSSSSSSSSDSSSSESEAARSTSQAGAQKRAARLAKSSDASTGQETQLVTPKKAKLQVGIVDATPDGKARSEAGSGSVAGSEKQIPRTSAAGAILTGGYNTHKVYVGNLPESATLEDLTDCFSQLGKCVCSIKRGFGFVEYEEASAASEAVAKYHEGHFLGAQIKVELSHARAPPHKDSGAPLDGSPGGTGCYVCGSDQHWARDCPEVGSGMMPVRNPPGSDRPSDPRKPMHINGPPKNGGASPAPVAGPSRPTPPPPGPGYPNRFGPPPPGAYPPMGPYGGPPPGWPPYGAPPPGYWGPDPRFGYPPPGPGYPPYPPQGGWPMYPAAYGPYPGMPPYPMYPHPGQGGPPPQLMGGPPPAGLLPPAAVDDRRSRGTQQPPAGQAQDRGGQRFDPYQRPASQSKRRSASPDRASASGAGAGGGGGGGARKEGTGNYQRPNKGSRK